MNKLLIVAVLFLIFIVGGLTVVELFLNKNTNTVVVANKNQTEKKLIPVDAILHSHGLATDVKDLKKLYIATHHGLYLLENDTNLYQIGESQDDYMGFTVHPENPKIFYSSGHPKTGGNLGFQKSTDGGYSWEHVSDVENSPVDFHAMTVSTVNPNLIYGWYQGKFYRTENAGEDWKSTQADFLATSIVADYKYENVVYVVSPQGQGVLISNNKGESWGVLSNELSGGIVSSFAINPKDNNKFLVFSEKIGGLGISSDSGKTWSKSNEDFNGEEILFISYSKQKPEIVYALSNTNNIYKSNDEGLTWMKLKYIST